MPRERKCVERDRLDTREKEERRSVNIRGFEKRERSVFETVKNVCVLSHAFQLRRRKKQGNFSLIILLIFFFLTISYS